MVSGRGGSAAAPHTAAHLLCPVVLGPFLHGPQARRLLLLLPTDPLLLGFKFGLPLLLGTQPRGSSWGAPTEPLPVPRPTTIFCFWYSSIFSSASLSCRSCSSLYLWFSSLMRLISAWIFFCCSCLRSKSCERGRGAEGRWDQSLPSGGGGLHGSGLFLRMFQPLQETRALILPPVVSPPRVSTPFQRGEGSPSSPPCPPRCFLPADLLVLQLQLLQVLQHLPRLLVPLLSSQRPLLRVLLYLLHQLLPPPARRGPPPAQP